MPAAINFYGGEDFGIQNLGGSGLGFFGDGGFGFAVQIGDYQGRTFVTNKATFLTRITTNATPSNLISISIKLKYRLFEASTF